MRGYHTASQKDDALQSRHLIVESLIKAGARVNYSNPVTKMTALHWLAYQNDPLAIDVLLKN